MAEKLDLKKKFKELYTASAKPVFVTVPPLRILSVDGAGDPNTSQEFSQAVEALFSVAYKLKFTAKKKLCWDYAVMPMEGLWWAADMARFSVERKEGWQWRIFIVQPEFITETMVAAAVAVVRKAKRERPATARWKAAFRPRRAACDYAEDAARRGKRPRHPRVRLLDIPRYG